MMKWLIPITFVLGLVIACTATEKQSNDKAPSHKLWDQLTKKHVSENGMVDYKGFIADKLQLEEYLKLLSDHAPDRNTWSREEQLAYWINAYNAFTVKLIVDNYPLESIRDLHPTLYIPGVNTVWHKKFFKIGGVATSLDEIEHDILRKQFDEPRIHFAINCASYSCPPLLKGAYFASKIDSQLQAAAIGFINDPMRNKINTHDAEVSKIFSWFTKDFTQQGTLREFLNQYAKTKLAPDADIHFMDYDWRLNEAKE